MSELDQESGTTEETIEQALTRNFASLGAETESTDSAPPAEDGDVTSDETEVELEAEQVQESQDALEPLEKWTDEQKDMFRSLELPAQQFLLDRHKDVESHLTKETQALSEIRKRYERLDEVLNPFDEALRPKGIELAPHLASALQYYFSYQQDPVSTLKALINTAGLEQSQIFEDEIDDPSIRALRTELNQTKQQLAAIQSQPNPDTQAAQRELDAFQSASNDDGTPKHPHFEQVKSLMAPLVADGKSLEDAYSEVLWTIPEHRKAQLEAERKKAESEIDKKRQEKVTKAKKAAETLPASDVEKSDPGKSEFKGWGEALKHTLSNMEAS